ncbi:MAG: hypothetical protein IBJ18_08140 [Phycisphaerales bacterium]|nr:hypothetical protein [Phycisphaerales bacterium]
MAKKPSSSSKPLVIQTEHLDDEPAAWLSERCQLEICPAENPKFPELLSKAQGLVIRTYTRITPALLKNAPKLKVVGRAGVGLDNVDLPACKAAGVRVVSTPDANTRAVIEYVLALLLDATRPRLFLSQVIEPERWKEVRSELRASRQLCEMTLGILGFGRIGSSLAAVAEKLHMRVIYHDLLEIPAKQRSGATPVSRDELLSTCDVLSIHVDGRPENRKLLTARDFALLKDNPIIINTSRGFVIDNHALADFMIAHPGALAMLDVHEPEPFDATYPLLDIPNVHLSPHIASSTDLAQKNMSWVVKDVWRVLEGQEPNFPA